MTEDKVRESVEKNKGKSGPHVGLCALYIAMLLAGGYLRREPPKALRNTNHEVRAFEILTFFIDLLERKFREIGYDDESYSIFGDSRRLAIAIIERIMGEKVGDVLSWRMNNYTSRMTSDKSFEWLLEVVQSIGGATSPRREYGPVEFDAKDNLELRFSLVPFIGEGAEKAAEWLAEIKAEFPDPEDVD